jgi:pimeloyl-ACP methyl ester carboxylesterase
MEEWTKLPKVEDLCNLLQSTLSIDKERCRAEQNTGLYRTHWGGLDASSVGESNILETIAIYVEQCREDDAAFAKIPIACARNSKSLEHATMAWNMRGDGGSEIEPETNNMIAGELLSRLLLAPLMLGTVSPRRVWHSMTREFPLFKHPIKTLVETREWHKLLAAQNIRTDAKYRGKEGETIKYKYWRWHGFLCRYLESDITENNAEAQKEGIVLVHGFGASSTQWTKAIRSLSNVLENYESYTQCLAPDLIGFGQSEKPPITYAGYTWEAYMSDFIKEIAGARCNMDSFIIGGNSIGGFVSICAAANDASVDDKAISGCGSPGTGKCNGAVLMNPAGVIQAKEDVMAIEQASGGALLRSVAQVTATDSLPPCKPLPRPIARAFGTGLLAYLRPRIQEICVNLYPTNPAAVDSELCDNILRDSQDPGAINVMISGSKLPLPRTYNEVIAADFGQSTDASVGESTFPGLILMAQGILDPLNDAKGRSESLGKLRDGIHIDQLQGGHCPHDEIPEQVASSIAIWMKETREQRLAMTAISLLQPSENF